jgi:hypothetical protein
MDKSFLKWFLSIKYNVYNYFILILTLFGFLLLWTNNELEFTNKITVTVIALLLNIINIAGSYTYWNHNIKK